MKRLADMVAVMMLCIALGFHWEAVQTVAWVGMLASRLPVMSAADALGETLDGKHPCRLCRLVDAGREAGKSSPEQPLEKAVKKLDFTLPGVALLLPKIPPARSPLGAQRVPAARSLSPPVPPPRAA